MGLSRVFLPLLVVAILEAMVMAAVADVIGWPITIIALVSTTLIGSALLRRQGLDTWARVNQRVARNEVPGRELLEGLLLLIGGVLLMAPGFLTDAFGLALLLPTSRRLISARLLRGGSWRSFGDNVFFHRGGPGGGFHGNVYEGDTVDEPEPATNDGPRRAPLTLEQTSDDDAHGDGPDRG